MTRPDISVRTYLLAALMIGSSGVGAAMAHDSDPAPQGVSHETFATSGKPRVLLEASESYRLVERDTAKGPCLALQLRSSGNEAETCAFEGAPVLAFDDAERGDQYIFGLTSADTNAVETVSANEKVSQAPVAAQGGRTKAFAIRVPGKASKRTVEVRERTAGGTLQRSTQH